MMKKNQQKEVKQQQLKEELEKQRQMKMQNDEQNQINEGERTTVCLLLPIDTLIPI